MSQPVPSWKHHQITKIRVMTSWHGWFLQIFLELLQPIAEEHTIVEHQEDLRGPKDGADQLKLT